MNLHKTKLLAAFFIVSLMFALPVNAYAACTMPAGEEGAIFFNDNVNVPQVCTPYGWVALGILNPGAGGGGCSNPPGTTGEIFYNANVHVPQYCDGDDWRAMIGTINGCQSPQDCPNVGDVCADGSLFAGFLADPAGGSCRIIYVTDNNQSTSSQWKTASGTNDIADPDNHFDGQYNRDNRGGGTFPAFELCEDNTYHGKSDWYLPARTELDLLWVNRAAIDANAAGNFTTLFYWSSTENPSNEAWYQGFGDGDQFYGNKTDATDTSVRCIRSVASVGGSSGETPTGCPNVGDVCSDGTVYSGLSLDGSIPMFATRCDAGQTWDGSSCAGSRYILTWNNGTVNNAETGFSNFVTGYANTQGLAALSDAGSPYAAAVYCNDLVQDGHSDWYLPAHSELQTLYSNRTAIGNFDISSYNYWTSSEVALNPTTAYPIDFNDGTYPWTTKLDGNYVRCVRK